MLREHRGAFWSTKNRVGRDKGQKEEVLRLLMDPVQTLPLRSGASLSPATTHRLFFKLIFVALSLLYNIVLVSAIQLCVVCCVLCLVAQLCPTLYDPMDYSPPGSSVHGDSPGKNTGVGCHALLQGIFPTQVSHTAGRFLTN